MEAVTCSEDLDSWITEMSESLARRCSLNACREDREGLVASRMRVEEPEPQPDPARDVDSRRLFSLFHAARDGLGASGDIEQELEDLRELVENAT